MVKIKRIGEVTRNTTERPEAIEAGAVELVGTETEKIVNETLALLNNTKHYQKMTKAKNPFGDGKACKRIVDYTIRNI